jgi:hypothetical protein
MRAHKLPSTRLGACRPLSCSSYTIRCQGARGCVWLLDTAPQPLVSVGANKQRSCLLKWVCAVILKSDYVYARSCIKIYPCIYGLDCHCSLQVYFCKERPEATMFYKRSGGRLQTSKPECNGACCGASNSFRSTCRAVSWGGNEWFDCPAWSSLQP